MKTVIALIIGCFCVRIQAAQIAGGKTPAEAYVGIDLPDKTVVYATDQKILDLDDKFTTSSTHKVILIDAADGVKGSTKTIIFNILQSSKGNVTVTVTNTKGDNRYEGTIDLQTISDRGTSDAVNEFCSLDSVKSEVNTGHGFSTPNDSNQFDGQMLVKGYISRGQARGKGDASQGAHPDPAHPGADTSQIKYNTPFLTVPRANPEFIKAAGIEEIRVTYSSGRKDDNNADIPKTDVFYRMNQADVFYYSGHGLSTDGGVFGGDIELKAVDIGNLWKEDLKVVILAGCALLVKNYKGRNPIETFVKLGPKYFVGFGGLWPDSKILQTTLDYGPSAPADELEKLELPDGAIGRDPTFTARIVKKYLEDDTTLNSPSKWLDACDYVATHGLDGAAVAVRGIKSVHSKLYHSCGAEVKGDGTYDYYYWDNTNPDNPVLSKKNFPMPK